MPDNPLAVIIEDDEFLVEIFSKALQAAEFQIEVIHDGQAALHRLNQITPNIIILDLHLPCVSGQDILRHIRAAAHLSQTRVMIATADHLTAELLRSQADLVLLKPVSFSQVRDLANRLKGNHLYS
jgi:two-component system phosphate regulon response regulator PhoB